MSSPEVEELMEAFKAMSTVVKAANINLRSGDLHIAEQNYVDALILFKKLENERGVRLHVYLGKSSRFLRNAFSYRASPLKWVEP